MNIDAQPQHFIRAKQALIGLSIAILLITAITAAANATERPNRDHAYRSQTQQYRNNSWSRDKDWRAHEYKANRYWSRQRHYEPQGRVIYAPPVIYSPPPYYQEPSVNFIIPLNIR